MIIPTPHISAKKGDFAKTVIMPGDPYRAKYIVDNYLTEVKIVSDGRGLIGYTGLLIFASVLQLICGLSYYFVAVKERSAQKVTAVAPCEALDKSVVEK